MNELLARSGKSSLNEMEVYVEAQVEDPIFKGDLSNGSFITTLYDPKIELKFLGKQPRSFKPNMPYTTYISVSNQDGTKISDAKKLKNPVGNLRHIKSFHSFVPEFKHGATRKDIKNSTVALFQIRYQARNHGRYRQRTGYIEKNHLPILQGERRLN
jgi:hypothetical protein